MPLPLYQGLHAPTQPNHNTMHMGLWFERYFSGYTKDFSKVDNETDSVTRASAKSLWLGQLKGLVGKREDLQAKAQKLHGLAAAQGGQVRVYRCAGSFVTGLGNAHPLENGFSWHPTLGTPYLSGSSVKGLVRALVETAYHGADRGELLTRWFGTEKKDDVAQSAGSFIFFDALPVEPCALYPEIMTPHMGKWYEKGDKNPLANETQPGDWHSPVPVGYLTARNIKLQFAIAPRAGAIAPDQIAQELENLWTALHNALQWLGAGAKTAIGFGVFAEDFSDRQARQASEQQAAQIERTEHMTAAQKLIDAFVLELRTKHEEFPKFKEKSNGEFHKKANTLAKAAHEGSDWSAQDKSAAAAAIEEWLPKLVQIDIKDERRKLKLAALKGL